MKVKNVSKKIVAIPELEGGCTALLPDCVAEVDDSFAGAIQNIIECGLLEVTKEKVTPPITAAEEPAEAEVKKTTRRSKAAKEAADIE